MESKPDTLKISASQREEIFANRADLFVNVKGSSLVSGDQAMKKAKEVSQLVEALTGLALSGGEGSGLSPEAIQLQGVHIESSSGAMLKSSSATYRLKIKCEKLDQLPDLLDIIASQKNTSLEHVQWKYPEDAAREQAMETALGKAKAKAEKIAKSLGVNLLGVYDFIENIYDEERPFPPLAVQAAPAAARAIKASEPSLSMDIQHGKMITVSVDIWYRVSEF